MYLTEATDKLCVYWLGQAGFWINMYGTTVLIDPYLSDSLAGKYANKLFTHKRLMPIPIPATELPRPDVVLITHAHTDHMDPDTLRPLASTHQDLVFCVPAASKATAMDRIGARQDIRLLNAGEKLQLDCGLQITVFPSAHESLDVTPDGLHPYLGYGLSKEERRVYHSGDTIPFEILELLIAKFAPEIALLPINGRDEYRNSNGVPGNMTAKEALSFCQRTKAVHLVPHHFGMFDFNTADPAELLEMSMRLDQPSVHVPVIGKAIAFEAKRSE